MKTPTHRHHARLSGSRRHCRSVAKAARFLPSAERLDERILLSTLTVSNLDDDGAGSLRAAIVAANAAAGSDTINFTVAGTIALTTGPLPAVTDTLNLDGTTAPGFKTTPLVEVNFNGAAGLQFNAGSSGSALRSIGLVGVGGDAVTLNDKNDLVVGNFIGVHLDGKTAGPNTGIGLVINATSGANTIGATTAVGTGLLSQASNLISSNGGGGIALHGSSGNTIIANYVGTDASGTAALPNGGDGLRLDAGSSSNTIGGVVPFVNMTGLVPQGNLISGNHGNGIVLTGASSNNFLAGNLVGTDATGNAALGNSGDGMDILGKSNGNTLQGTVVGQSPFIYANIFDGNLGNGLRIRDSDKTTIQANIFGLGQDNMTPLGNGLDGVLIEGSSNGIEFGGQIPLGNITTANGRNGVELRDTVTNFQAFNTFAGMAAFKPYTNLGNMQDGFLITSTGGGNQLRTNVISSNHGNGVEIAGSATGVQVTSNIIGLNTDGKTPFPNGANGVLVTGEANGNIIGGPLDSFSIIPRNIISGNVGHGVAITGNAHNNQVTDSYIGTTVMGATAAGNGGAGIYLGGTTFGNTIGGTTTDARNLISGNAGNGVEIIGGATNNAFQGNLIGTDASGALPLLNGGSGFFIDGSSNNVIGGAAAGEGNVIAFNAGAGVFVNSGTGNAIVRNSIAQNHSAGIVLQKGANGDQAAPRLMRILRRRRNSIIRGTLRAAANSTYTVELFSNAANTRSTPGGQTYLATMTVTTNANGVGRILFSVANQPRGAFFTATATSAAKNTSAFSNAVPGRSR